MIYTLLIAAHLTGMVLADKPYRIVYVVNYGGGVPNQTYRRSFKDEFKAWQFYLNAPRCYPSIPAAYPCVEKIEMFTIYTTDDRKASNR